MKDYKNHVLNYNTIKNNENGITLIALIVTIIVLLILASVVVGTITGDNGIIQRTKEAAATHNSAYEQEATANNELKNNVNKLINNKSNKVSKAIVDVGNYSLFVYYESGTIAKSGTTEPATGDALNDWFEYDKSNETILATGVNNIKEFKGDYYLTTNNEVYALNESTMKYEMQYTLWDVKDIYFIDTWKCYYVTTDGKFYHYDQGETEFIANDVKKCGFDYYITNDNKVYRSLNGNDEYTLAWTDVKEYYAGLYVLKTNGDLVQKNSSTSQEIILASDVKKANGAQGTSYISRNNKYYMVNNISTMTYSYVCDNIKDYVLSLYRHDVIVTKDDRILDCYKNGSILELCNKAISYGKDYYQEENGTIHFYLRGVM